MQSPLPTFASADLSPEPLVTNSLCRVPLDLCRDPAAATRPHLPHPIPVSFTRTCYRCPSDQGCIASVYRDVEAPRPYKAPATFDCGDPHG